ncbi:EscU/YscU/HrcU family type III secretion system export apparatus switch protein [Sphingomicrobium astaxanthinifaciens]|uniref:EscU/YscU/HrcU family type III secretion system export apparatus switch protein n=1 Tax=Sphingomicrobium astaxanthinifaciens TaxID=1227949 RepID=UPI001FCBA3C0|nr:EscU/YscU/HrcU family type III secretion system export apparatus switch protein [Sphingomicrobium astaxanthinifaciens]MCJ7420354.1 EscU/YscU/HrcU family type III secretion system export apparatus switch protein [Sphingomicrobium astaxanthinifaciens]
MSESDSGEKTFAPTPKRIQDAVEKGDVLRSKDLAAAVTVILGCVWLWIAGPWVLNLWRDEFHQAFNFDRQSLEEFDFSSLLLSGGEAVLLTALTIALPVMVAVVISQFVFGKGRWVTKNLAFKGKRINPGAGLKRMFGPTGLIEMGKGILKLGLLGSIAGFWVVSWLEPIFGLGQGNLSQQLQVAFDALISLLISLCGGLILIAIVDVLIQWIRRSKRLKMSHREMKDENKNAEGSPEAKAARRQRQRDIASGGLTFALKDAQFVLANPTHFSVAIVYDPERAAAPIVLARGAGDKALAMREIATGMDLPVLEFPQLTRAVYYTSRENQMIHEDLYASIAAVLAFVYSLKRGDRVAPPSIEVPHNLRFDSEGRRSA